MNNSKQKTFETGGQLTTIDGGFKHNDINLENKLGGIPMGIGPNGQPNLVEQGETKLNSDDYIFSDTLKVDKEVAESFNLPKTVVGKTFAEVSKKLNKPYSRREGDTIEQLDTKKNLDKLMNAQEAFKQFEVEKKLAEINSLDPNLLGSLMNQGQPTPMQSQQQQAEQLQQPMDPSMVQQMTDENGGAPMMKLGGYMYGNGGGLSYTVSNPNNLQQPPTEFQYPASARDAIIYNNQEEAMKALFLGENDATRTYYNNPETGVMGEFVGNQDAKNTNFQDWGPEKSNSIVKQTQFMPTDGSYVDPTEGGKYGNGVITSYNTINNPNKKDLGGWLQDNKQGVLGGLQAAAGIGAMFIPGAQGLGTNLITGGAKNIMGEVIQDNQPNPNAQQVVQNTNLPMGINFKYGGNMFDEGGKAKKFNEQTPFLPQQAYYYDTYPTPYIGQTPLNISNPTQEDYLDMSNKLQKVFPQNTPTQKPVSEEVLKNAGLAFNGLYNNPLPQKQLSQEELNKIGNTVNTFFPQTSISQTSNLNTTNEVPIEVNSPTTAFMPTNQEEVVDVTKNIIDSNDDDYYKVSEVPNNVLTNPSQLFSGNYQGTSVNTANKIPGSGVYTPEYLTALERAKQELGDNNVNLDITQKPWELALQGLPVAYNVGRGLFEKPMQLKESDYMQKPIEAYKMNVDPQIAATREAYAGATAGLKNNIPGLGAYLTNRSSIANSEAQAKRDIYAGKENADNQLQLNADIQNAQLLGQNNQNKMAIQQFNAQAKEAKKQLLGAGLVQGSQIGRASVDTNLQKEMMKLVSPAFTEWLKTQNKSKV